MIRNDVQTNNSTHKKENTLKQQSVTDLFSKTSKYNDFSYKL